MTRPSRRGDSAGSSSFLAKDRWVRTHPAGWRGWKGGCWTHHYLGQTLILCSPAAAKPGSPCVTCAQRAFSRAEPAFPSCGGYRLLTAMPPFVLHAGRSLPREGARFATTRGGAARSRRRGVGAPGLGSAGGTGLARVGSQPSGQGVPLLHHAFKSNPSWEHRALPWRGGPAPRAVAGAPDDDT